jgi:hypothetical protein
MGRNVRTFYMAVLIGNLQAWLPDRNYTDADCIRCFQQNIARMPI